VQTNVDETQVEIRLTTKLPEKFRIPDDKIVVPGSLARLDLSELVNDSLSLETRVPFDFLINNEFLRGSIAVHSAERGILSEKTLEIEYVIAMEEPESREITEPQKEWISCISMDGENLFTSSVDGILTRYNIENGKQLRKSIQSSLPLTGVSCSDNGVVVTSGKDGYIRFSHSESLEVIASGKIEGGFRCVSLCPLDQTLALTGSSSGIVHLWNVPVSVKAEGKKKRSSASQTEPRASVLETSSAVVAVSWLSLSRAIAACEDGTVHIFDPISTETFPTITTNRAISAMTVLGDSKIVTGHPDGRIIFWDIKKEGRAINLEAINSCRSHSRMISSLCGRPGSDVMVVSASVDGCVKVFDSRASHYAIQSISLPESERALSVQWIDESKFVSGGSDGIVRMHSIKLD
jgi:ribosome biogenesis protein YTM1